MGLRDRSPAHSAGGNSLAADRKTCACMRRPPNWLHARAIAFARMEIDAAVVSRFFDKTCWSMTESWDGSHCLNWTASAGTKTGKGRFWDGQRFWVAAQFAYVIEHGNLPDGMVVWLNCGNRLCVNHLHLEAVTKTESVRRAHMRWKPSPTFRCCGREKTDDNSYRTKAGGRRCKACAAAALHRHRQARRPETVGEQAVGATADQRAAAQVASQEKA